jgi:hypothetical protein
MAAPTFVTFAGEKELNASVRLAVTRLTRLTVAVAANCQHLTGPHKSLPFSILQAHAKQIRTPSLIGTIRDHAGLRYMHCASTKPPTQPPNGPQHSAISDSQQGCGHKVPRDSPSYCSVHAGMSVLPPRRPTQHPMASSATRTL